MNSKAHGPPVLEIMDGFPFQLRRLRIKVVVGGLPCDPVVKNLPANAGDRGSIPGLGRFHTLQVIKLVHHNYRSLRALEPVLCNRSEKPEHHN